MAGESDIPYEQVLENVRRFYSESMIDHAMNPRNVGELPEADGYASDTGDCGDRFEIWLRIKNDTITEARFWTDGCAAQIACGSTVTEIIKGKPLTEIHRLTARQVVNALGGLPEENKHCALRAVAVVKEAVKDAILNGREPWRKGYRKRQG